MTNLNEILAQKEIAKSLNIQRNVNSAIDIQEALLYILFKAEKVERNGMIITFQFNNTFYKVEPTIADKVDTWQIVVWNKVTNYGMTSTLVMARIAMILA